MKELEKEIKEYIVGTNKIINDEKSLELIQKIKELKKLNPNKSDKYVIWNEVVIEMKKDYNKSKKKQK